MRHGGDRGGGGGSSTSGGFSYPPFGSFSSLGGVGSGGLPGLPTFDAQLNTTPLVSWTFAGFADGTVAVFDERVPNYPLAGGGSSLPAGGLGSHHHHRVASTVPAGRVHCSRDHSAWVVSAHLRADGVPEVGR